MFITKENIKVESRAADGSIQLAHFMTEKECKGAGRMFSHVTLKKGALIDYHQHVGECECYYIINGTASVLDNGVRMELHPGDSHICLDGGWHSIEGVSETPMEFIAMILKTPKV